MQIKVKNISKEYDKGLPSYIKVLNDVSLEISPGERISIIGPTGSGKTTLIEHLNALIIPDKGTISYQGVPLKVKMTAGKKLKIKKNMTDQEILEVKAHNELVDQKKARN